MTRRSAPTMVGTVTHFLQSLFGRGRRVIENKPHLRRSYGFESLEGRAMFATNLGEIQGQVYIDATGNGFNNGEQVVAASVKLYQDTNTNGVFEPGAPDALIATVPTNAQGVYQFTGLSAGSYFVEQIAQTVGGVSLSDQHSNPITISALQAQGQAGQSIDSYSSAGPTVTTTNVLNSTSFASNLAAPEALGGSRSLKATLTALSAGATALDVAQASVSGNVLSISTGNHAQGVFNEVWDKTDHSATDPVTNINPIGLDVAGVGVDLTKVGATSGVADRIVMSIGTDHAGVSALLRIYTDATHYSDQTIVIPNTGGSGAKQSQTFLYSGFTTGAGAAGTATLTNVGAIELQLTSTVDATQAEVSLIGAIGPTIITQDFANNSDLSITKTITSPIGANASITVGTNVTFHITVTNAGPGDANNVTVTDLLPAGLTYVSDTGAGAYNHTTGLWTVGTVPAAAGTNSKTLDIVATVATTGQKTNTATVTHNDNFDPTQPDTATVNVTPQVVNLSLTKAVNVAKPNVNDNVQFTITVADAVASDNATGVKVTDLLPAGITYQSDDGGGAYNSGTGVWTVGTVNAAASAVLHITGKVTTLGAKINTATITAVDQSNTSTTTTGNATVTPQQIDLTIVKQAKDDATTTLIADSSVSTTNSNSKVNKSQLLDFVITVSNAVGMDPATTVKIKDLLPGGVTYVSDNGAGAYNSGTGIWSVPTINAAASQTLTIKATVSPTAGAATSIVNTAEIISADQKDIDSTFGDGIGTSTVGPQSDLGKITLTTSNAELAVAKTVTNSTPNKNAPLTFTITVHNNGPDGATNLHLTDVLPAASLGSITANTANGTFNTNTGDWNIGVLASGSTATLTVNATAINSAAFSNTASVGSVDQFDSVPANNTATVNLTPPVTNISVTKTVDNASPKLNTNVTFTITAANTTAVPATGVQLTDLLPAGLTLVSSTPSVGTYTSGTGVWNIGNLAANASATLTIVATVTTTGAKANTASVTTVDQFETLTTDNTATANISTTLILTRRLCISRRTVS